MCRQWQLPKRYTKWCCSIQFHWFLMLAMPGQSHHSSSDSRSSWELQQPRLGITQVQRTNKLHSHFERLDAFVSEGRPLRKGCNVTQCCPTPGTTKVRARTASLQLETDKPAPGCSISPPSCSQGFGEGECRKLALFLLPKAKQKWSAITATFKPHKHSKQHEVFIFWANSHRTFAFCQVSFYHYPNRSGGCHRRVYFKRAEMSLLLVVFFCPYLRSQFSSNDKLQDSGFRA